LLFVFVFLPLSLYIPFVPPLIIPLWIYFSSFLVFVILSRSLRGWELKGSGGGEVEAWRTGLGLALAPELEEEQAKGRGKGGE
jgi:hypothetical protein